MNATKLLRWSAAGALVLLLFAALWEPAQFFRSAFFAVMLWLCVTLGALAQLMTHHLSGGRWGFAVRRILEAALLPLPMLALAFACVAAGIPVLWQGRGYFHPAWVIVRAAICFGIWIWLAWRLVAWSREQDRHADNLLPGRFRRLSGPGLVLYFLTMSFAMLDWIMQLEPGWRSTMFPTIIIASQTLFALAGAIAAASVLLPLHEERVRRIVTTQAWHDLGKLLFAFVIFWAYVAFAQFLIIWCGNLPHESTWYLHRSRAGWEWLAWGIAVACFFGPAAALLCQPPKKNRRVLAGIAVGVWISQAIYLFWVIAPSFFPAFHISWMDGAVPLALGMVWMALFWFGWTGADPIPRGDPRLNEWEVHAA